MIIFLRLSANDNILPFSFWYKNLQWTSFSSPLCFASMLTAECKQIKVAKKDNIVLHLLHLCSYSYIYSFASFLSAKVDHKWHLDSSPNIWNKKSPEKLLRYALTSVISVWSQSDLRVLPECLQSDPRVISKWSQSDPQKRQREWNQLHQWAEWKFKKLPIFLWFSFFFILMLKPHLVCPVAPATLLSVRTPVPSS